MLNPIGNQAVKDALANLGVHEDPPGSNRGKYVDTYNTFVGAPLGSAWCCSFLLFRLYHAAEELKLKTDVLKTGSVQQLFKWAEKEGRVYKQPVAGDVFVLWFNNLRRYAHTGLIVDVIIEKGLVKILTVEGNTSATGSREGTLVAKKTRTWTEEFRALRLG